MQGSSTGVSVGTVIIWPTAAWQQDMKSAGGQPDNFLECNGQAVDAGKYPKLVKIMATVPNYQGLFLRGLGGNSGSIRQVQGDAIRNITGTMLGSSSDSVGLWDDGNGVFYKFNLGRQSVGTSTKYYSYVAQGMGFDISRVVPTAVENRPINTAVIYLIRAK